MQDTTVFAVLCLISVAWHNWAGYDVIGEQPCIVLTVPALLMCCTAGNEQCIQVSWVLLQHIFLWEANVIGLQLSLFIQSYLPIGHNFRVPPGWILNIIQSR